MPMPTPSAGNPARNPNESTLYVFALGLGTAPCVKISRKLRDFHAARRKLFTSSNPKGIAPSSHAFRHPDFGI
jgi:hypothetical protein